MKYSAQADSAITYAKRISKKLKHNYIGTEHLLLGLTHIKESISAGVLANNGVTEENLLSLIDELIKPDTDIVVQEKDGLTPKFNYILEQAEDEAALSELEEIGTEHILIAIIKTPDCAATRLLASMNVNFQKMFNDIVVSMGQSGVTYRDESMRKARQEQRNYNRPSLLEQYSRNLSELARNGELDPIIGREKEIERVIEILTTSARCSRGRNNV